MDISVEHAPFTAAIAAAGRIVPARPVEPEHAGILLVASDGVVEVQAFDLETSLAVQVAADVDTPGAALVSGSLLAQVAKVMPRKPIHAAVAGSSLAVAAGSSTFGLPLLAAERYPALPVADAATGVVDGETFAAAVALARSALTGGDATALKGLFGIRVEADGDQLAVVATDKYRFGLGMMAWSGPAAELLLPADELAAIAAPIAGEATLHFGRTFGISTDTTASTIRSIDQGYPAWRRIIGHEHIAMVSLEVGELVAALRRAETVAGKLPHVILTTGVDELRITAGGKDSLGAATATVECKTTGAEVAVKINATYLHSMAAALKSPCVTLGFSDPTNVKPILGYPVDQVGSLDKPEADRLIAVMPVRY